MFSFGDVSVFLRRSLAILQMKKRGARLTWTTQKPNQDGWYWMLNPAQEPALPTIVQIMREWQTGRWVVFIPASRYPENSGMLVEIQHLEAMWAGPLEIPSLLGDANQQDTSAAELAEKIAR